MILICKTYICVYFFFFRADPIRKFYDPSADSNRLIFSQVELVQLRISQSQLTAPNQNLLAPPTWTEVTFSCITTIVVQIYVFVFKLLIIILATICSIETIQSYEISLCVRRPVGASGSPAHHSQIQQRAS